MKKSYIGILLVLPSVALIAFICVYPLSYALYLSLHRLFAFGSEVFVGLRNFTFLVNYPPFWNAFKNGLIWTAGTLSLQVLLGLATALTLNEPFKGRSIIRGAVLFPYVVPSIAAIILFRMSLLHVSWGFINQILGTQIPWLGSMKLAMFTVILVGAWKFYPFVTIALLARLQTIPRELYEASKVDGAGALARFRHITLPALKDILMVTILLRTIFMYTKFDVPWLLTHGGPQSSTTTLPILAYVTSFSMLRRGLGSAVGVTMFIVLIVIAVVYFRIYKIR